MFHNLVIMNTFDLHLINIGPFLSVCATLLGYFGALNPTIIIPFLTFGRRSIAGSVISGIAQTQELLNFCGKNNIGADVEVIKIQDINEAFERMKKSEVKYRFVIDMSSLQSDQ